MGHNERRGPEKHRGESLFFIKYNATLETSMINRDTGKLTER
jgi:hypothetical protein